MHFIVDKERMIIFGWSAKCGSSHLKKIIKFLNFNNSEIKDKMSLPSDIWNYTTLIFIRNPYKRLVSGFLDKYNESGEMRKRWKQKELTFTTFVEELINKKWKMVDFHHFTPQTTEKFNIKIMNSKEIKCFDIENINYNYIQYLYKRNIPLRLIEFKGLHKRKKYDSCITHNIFDLNIDDYYENNIDLKYFYNAELKKKIYNFYKNDFFFFKNIFNITYTL